MRLRFFSHSISISSLLLLLATTAFAHHLPPGMEEIDEFSNGASFLAGFNHPVMGLDHLIAALITGVCAARVGKWGIWLLAAAGVAMAAGYAGGFGGLRLPGGDLMIAATVVISAVVMAGSSSRQILPAATLTASFQLWHGNLHALEMPSGAGSSAHASGAVCATVLCMVCGWALATLSFRRSIGNSHRVIPSH